MIELHPTPLYIIHLSEKDGDVVISNIKSYNFERYITENNLGLDEYAVIKGNLLKDFPNRQFNIDSFILKTKGA